MKTHPTDAPDKTCSMKELQSILKRNDGSFAQQVLTYAAVLEKIVKK